MVDVYPIRVRDLDHRLVAIGSGASNAASVCFCTFFLLYFEIVSAAEYHWFVIPVSLCGILIGCDAADWIRGRLDIFDPVGIIGLLGVLFFFCTP